MYTVTVKVLKIHILSPGEKIISDRNTFLCILCLMRMRLTLGLFFYNSILRGVHADFTFLNVLLSEQKL